MVRSNWRGSLDELFDTGGADWMHGPPPCLVEVTAAPRQRRRPPSERRQRSRVGGLSTDPGFVLHESGCCDCGRCWLRPAATTPAYRDYRDRYRKMAQTLGFEGHMAWAEAMP